MAFEDWLGRRVKMTVRDIVSHGAYLVATDSVGEHRPPALLLPRRELPAELKPNDALEVFVYLDSEERPIATTTLPRVELGQVAFLSVTDMAPFGAFVDWNLPKELLVPKAEQICEMYVGQRYPIGLIRDDTGRLAGTMRVTEMLRHKPNFRPDEWVYGEAWRNQADLGIFVIVERRYVGLLPVGEPHRLARGQGARFRVSNVFADGKFELSLRRHAFEEMEDDAGKVLELLRRPQAPRCGDHSNPDQIRSYFGLSKKAFKRAIGRLLKRGLVRLDQQGNAIAEP